MSGVRAALKKSARRSHEHSEPKSTVELKEVRRFKAKMAVIENSADLPKGGREKVVVADEELNNAVAVGSSRAAVDNSEGIDSRGAVENSGVAAGAVDNSEGAVDNSETAVDNSETAVDNSETAVDNSETAVDNSDIAEDNSETAEDNSETAENNNETAVDNSEIAVDNSETAENNNETAENNNETEVDNSDIAVDNSETAVDNSEMAVDNSEIAVDNSEIAVDNSGTGDGDHNNDAPPAFSSHLQNRWRFHPHCGRHVVLWEDRWVAKRIVEHSTFSGMVMGEEAMESGTLYQVRLDKTSSLKSRHNFHCGVVTVPPVEANLPTVLPLAWRQAIILFNDRVEDHGKAIFENRVGSRLVNLKRGTRVGLMVDQTHYLHLYINGKYHGIVASEVHRPCYPVYAVNGRYTQISTMPLKPAVLPQAVIRRHLECFCICRPEH